LAVPVFHTRIAVLFVFRMFRCDAKRDRSRWPRESRQPLATGCQALPGRSDCVAAPGLDVGTGGRRFRAASSPHSAAKLL
jgi:hypothetical protein